MLTLSEGEVGRRQEEGLQLALNLLSVQGP